MSLDDRDYYRAELARRMRRTRWGRLPLLRPLSAICAILVAVSAAAPLVMTPRATYRESWRSLAEQVTGNMNCIRMAGFMSYVRPRPCGAPPSALPTIERHSPLR
jgi:hypothetical protein